MTAAEPKKNMAKNNMICVKQIGSPIRRDPRQVLYLKSLGLGKINRMRQVADNPSTRGLLDKLRHMVVVVEQ
jgi:large subunit ribosomal protein L30